MTSHSRCSPRSGTRAADQAEARRAVALSGLIAGTCAELADQYTDILAFGWRGRVDRLTDPKQDFGDLCLHDDRMQAALTALTCLGEPARRHVRGLLNEPMRSAELFALTCYALTVRDGDLLDASGALATAIPELQRAQVDALAWAPASPMFERSIEALPPPERLRLVGLRHRDVPGMAERTLAWLRTLPPNAPNVAAALQLFRAFGRTDLTSVAVSCLGHAHEAVRLAAAQAVLTLAPPDRHAQACDTLRTLSANEDATISAAAVQALVLHAGAPVATTLPHLPAQLQTRRLQLQAMGWLGQVDAVPELIDALGDPQHGRAAGAALALITGSAPDRDGWAATPPEHTHPAASAAALAGFAAGDDDAPPPDPAAFEDWWNGHRARFAFGRRYLGGHPIAPTGLRAILTAGLLPWRPLAAQHLQRLTQGALFPTELRAAVQRTLLLELN